MRYFLTFFVLSTLLTFGILQNINHNVVSDINLTDTIISSVALGFMLGTFLFTIVRTYKISNIKRTENSIIESTEIKPIDIDKNIYVKINGDSYTLNVLNKDNEVKEINVGSDNINFEYSTKNDFKIVKYGKKYKKEEVENNHWLFNFEKNDFVYNKTVVYIPKQSIM